MEKILAQKRKNGLWMGILLILAIVGRLSGSPALYAATYSSVWTGYAMGNLSGGGGAIVQGVFANHNPDRCPSDPAAWWPFGTFIQNLDYYVIMVDGSGWSYQLDGFELRDVGDYSCMRPNYWVDVYFGRYRLPSDPCSCPGVSGSICYLGADNSCDDARQFGYNPNTRYIGPD